MGIFDFFRKKPKTLLDVMEANPMFQEQKKLFEAMSAMCADGVDSDEMPNGQGEYGLESSNPIPCKTIFGSTAYLGRLRTIDGVKVTYDRIGSFESDVSPYPVDGYAIAHPNGESLGTIYISPYQQRISSKAPKGFVLAKDSFS